MLPDEEFVLDRHPSWKNIVIGAGFSGRLTTISAIGEWLHITKKKDINTLLCMYNMF